MNHWQRTDLTRQIKKITCKNFQLPEQNIRADFRQSSSSVSVCYTILLPSKWWFVGRFLLPTLFGMGYLFSGGRLDTLWVWSVSSRTPANFTHSFPNKSFLSILEIINWGPRHISVWNICFYLICWKQI